MKVFDLRCEHDHRFEGWFGAAGDFEAQCARGLLVCPVCESTKVVKMPSAPHLNLSSSNADVSDRHAQQRERALQARREAAHRAPGARHDGVPGDGRSDDRSLDSSHGRGEQAAAAQRGAGQAGSMAAGAGPTPAQQASWLRAVREVLEKTENVGEQFAEEARRIHYNEAPPRAIRGVASLEETQALVEEGIDVVSLPMPAALKETLQ